MARHVHRHPNTTGSPNKTGRWLLGAAAVLAGAAVANHLVARRSERRHPPLGRFLTVDGVRLHVIEAGEGTPIVLLHGNGAMAEDFVLSGVFDALAQNHRVIAFDRPGFGHSDRPRSTVWTARAQARLLHRALRRMGAEGAVLVGHSWGTLVALRIALDHPEDVASLVLLSGYYTPTPRSDVVLFTGPAIPVIGDVLRYTVAPLASLLILPILLRKIFSPDPVPAHFRHGFPFGLALRPSQLRASAADTALMIPSAAAMRHRHGELTMPVTILAGDGDRIVDLGRQSARLHREVPGSELRVVPGTGHMIYHTAPEEVLLAIEHAAARVDRVEPAEAVAPP
jgi:pimeloyl-ACP methyl ester carboxylesterase